MRQRYGYRRIHVLLRRESWAINHKRVLRLYREEGLNLRSKRPRRHLMAAHRLDRLPAARPNQIWAMDFVSDALFNGRRFRALTIVDAFTRECLAIHVDRGIRGEDVVAVMERLLFLRSQGPEKVRVDNGRRSSLRSWTIGPAGTASFWTSPGPANPPTIPMWKV